MKHVFLSSLSFFIVISCAGGFGNLDEARKDSTRSILGWNSSGTINYPDQYGCRIDQISLKNNSLFLECSINSDHIYVLKSVNPVSLLSLDKQSLLTENQITIDPCYNVRCKPEFDDAGNVIVGSYSIPCCIFKFDSFLNPSLEPILLNSEFGKILSSESDSTGQYIYFGTDSLPARVIKLRTNDYAIEGYLQLLESDGFASKLIMDSNDQFLYIGTNNVPNRIVKIQLDIFARIEYAEGDSNDKRVNSMAIDNEDLYLYVCDSGTPSKYIKYSLSNFQKNDSLTLNTGESNIYSILIPEPGDNAYLSDGSDQGGIIQIDLDSFTRVGRLDLNSDEESVYCGAYDPATNYAYYGTYQEPAKLIKVDFNPLTRVDGTTFEGVEKQLHFAARNPHDNQLYFASYYSSPSTIIRVNPVSFERETSLECSSGISNISCGAIDPASNFCYLGTYTSQGKIVKIDLSTLSEAGTITLSAGVGFLTSALIDGSNAYFSAANKIVQVDLVEFKVTKTIDLLAGESAVKTGVLDGVNHIAYYGIDTSPGQIVKVGLNPFQRLTSLTLNSGENSVRCSSMDSVSGYAYFGTSTAPGKCIRIRLSDFSHAGSISFNSGENNPASAVIDSTRQVIHFGCDTSPGKVVVVGLSSFERLVCIDADCGENQLMCGVLDTISGFTFWGTDTTTGQIIRIGKTQAYSIKGSRAVLSESGRADTIWFFSHFPAGSFRLAVYDEAYGLLWESPSIGNTGDDEWVTFPISSGYPSELNMIPGTYWLMWQVNSNEDVPSWTEGGSACGIKLFYEYDFFPENLTEGESTSDLWSMYVNYTAFTATPTPSATGTSTSTASRTPTRTATSTPSPSRTPTWTSSPSPTLTDTPIVTSTHTAVPSATQTPVSSYTPTSHPTTTSTPQPTESPTSYPTFTSTRTSTPTPVSSHTPTSNPTVTLTPQPTSSPSPSPSGTIPGTSTQTPVPSFTQTPIPSLTGTATSTRTPSVTPAASVSPSPSATTSPTSTSIPPSSTPSAIFSFTPTATPRPGSGVYLNLSKDIFHPGDHFLLTAELFNANPNLITVDLYIILDVYGMYWFFPCWSQDLCYQERSPFLGSQNESILDFIWPDAGGSADNLIFWAAMLETGKNTLFGNYSFVMFGYRSSDIPTPTPTPVRTATMTPAASFTPGPTPTNLPTSTPSVTPLEIIFLNDDYSDYPGEGCEEEGIFCFSPRTVAMGCSSWQSCVEIRNTGTQSIHVQLDLGGDHPSVFEIQEAMTFQLLPSSQITLHLRFCPQIPPGPGMMKSELSIQGDGHSRTLQLKAFLPAG